MFFDKLMKHINIVLHNLYFNSFCAANIFPEMIRPVLYKWGEGKDWEKCTNLFALL